MVIVKLKDTGINESEQLIANALVASINQDVCDLSCRCNEDSYLKVIVDKSKITAVRTDIEACCDEFKDEIEEALFAVEV